MPFFRVPSTKAFLKIHRSVQVFMTFQKCVRFDYNDEFYAKKLREISSHYSKRAMKRKKNRTSQQNFLLCLAIFGDVSIVRFSKCFVNTKPFFHMQISVI